MRIRGESELRVKRFNSKTPAESFRNVGAEGAAALITAATDIALVVDSKGIVRDLSFGDEEIAHDEYEEWIDKPWVDTVTVESRPKAETLLKEAGSPASKWRQVNHPSSSGADLPILYATMPIGDSGNILAVGRNVTPMAELQQRLLQSQRSMEKSYLRIRHLETRYRLLFQVSSEAVLILDAGNMRVLEANPAAERMLGKDKNKIVGRNLTELFDRSGAGLVENLLVDVRASGGRLQTRVRLAGQKSECILSASMFNQDGGSLYLVRATRPEEHADRESGFHLDAKLIELMEGAPDGIVVTASDGRILAANRSFVEMTQSGAKVRVLGESLDRWFGRSGVDLNVLTASLREHGSVRLFATTLHSEYGSSIDVEISATQVSMNQDEECFGFMIRDTGIRLVDNVSRKQPRLSRPVEQLTELVGRLPLRDLVQESTSLVERYCIEAALELTGNNRTSAAELLGLSRQSLYVKLRSYGLGDSNLEKM